MVRFSSNGAVSESINQMPTFVNRYAQPWCPPRPTLTISGDEVHVWRASIATPKSRVQSLECILTEDELCRAKRFYFQRDRERFIVARGLLRCILGRYLGIEPSRLRFSYNDCGKPALATAPDEGTLCFNLSHSDRLALYAVTRGRKVGIDLERVRAIPEIEQIAKCSFSSRENAVFCSLPLGLRKEAFFSCWTRKEAYVKARGKGLSLSLAQFDVSLVPGEPARLLDVRGDSPDALHWSLRELKPGPDYVAALAVKGHACKLKCWHFPEPGS